MRHVRCPWWLQEVRGWMAVSGVRFGRWLLGVAIAATCSAASSAVILSSSCSDIA